jgi:hypothetical protein
MPPQNRRNGGTPVSYLGRSVLRKDPCDMRTGIAEPEETSIARQWLSKYIPTATNMYETTEEPLEVVFLMQPIPRLYNKDQHDSVKQKNTGHGSHRACNQEC